VCVPALLSVGRIHPVAFSVIPEKTILHGSRVDSWFCGGVRVILSIVIWLFAAIVVIGAVVFLVLDAMDKVESIQKRAPWITKILERRGALVALLMVCMVLLVGNGYELVTKELPDVPAPPTVSFASPASPRITIHQLPQPIKEQCWVRNYAVPAIPSPIVVDRVIRAETSAHHRSDTVQGQHGAPSSWGLATVLCNTSIKPPYSVELDYGEAVTIGPFTFPVGSEFSKSAVFNKGTKAVAMFDLHTIIPNEPFSIMASGSTGKFPLVKTGVIRAKGRVFEFHP
jgi:hypothetical protein